MMKRFIFGLLGFVVVWIVRLAPQFLAYAHVSGIIIFALERVRVHPCNVVRAFYNATVRAASVQRFSFFRVVLFSLYCPSHDTPLVIIFISLPPFSGLTKIVSFASPRLRLRIEEFGVIRSRPSFAHPWPFKLAANSAQAVFTCDLLLKDSCSTIDL